MQSAGRAYVEIKAVVQVYQQLFVLQTEKERFGYDSKVAVIMGSDSDWPVVKGPVPS